MVILQAVIDTSSMVALLASLCVILIGALAYIYKSKEKTITDVRDEHLKDLRERNEMSNAQNNLMQTLINDVKEIKQYISNVK